MSQQTVYSRSSVHEPAADPQSDQLPPLSQDEIFHILQVSRRRETICYLLERDGPTKMRDIAEHVAANEHNTTVEELTSRQRQRVYIPLYQSHLPKLDTKGIIEYEKSRGIVQPAEQLEIFRPYLENPDANEIDEPIADDRSTHTYSVLAMAASASLLGAAVVGDLSISALALSMLLTTLVVLAIFVPKVAASHLPYVS